MTNSKSAPDLKFQQDEEINSIINKHNNFLIALGLFTSVQFSLLLMLL